MEVAFFVAQLCRFLILVEGVLRRTGVEFSGGIEICSVVIMTIQIWNDEISLTGICAQHLVKTHLGAEGIERKFHRDRIAAVGAIGNISTHFARFIDLDWSGVTVGLVNFIDSFITTRFIWSGDIIVNVTIRVAIGVRQLERQIKFARIARSLRSE